METIAPPVVFCKVFFDRPARQYMVRNGCEVARFPMGQENKVKAQWTAIEHDRPDVYAIVRELASEPGADESRVIRAARLVIEGRVIESNFDSGLVRARVMASKGDHSPVTGWPHYQVTHNLVWSCDCTDYHHRTEASDRRPCQHIYTMMITERLMGHESTQMSRSNEPDRSTALPPHVCDQGSTEDWLGYDEPVNRFQFAHNYDSN